jgi:hypothetical protein
MSEDPVAVMLGFAVFMAVIATISLAIDLLMRNPRYKKWWNS